MHRIRVHRDFQPTGEGSAQEVLLKGISPESTCFLRRNLVSYAINLEELGGINPARFGFFQLYFFLGP